MAIFFACSIMTVLFHVKTASALKAELPAAPTEPTKEAVALPACGCLTPKTLQYGMIAWHFIIWLPTATIVLLYLVKAIEPPASSVSTGLTRLTGPTRPPLLVFSAEQVRRPKIFVRVPAEVC